VNMKGFSSLYLLLVALVALVFSVRAEEAAAKEFVVTLSTSNFEKFITENLISLIEFYAPWCGHCKRLAPEFEKAAEKLQASGGIPLAKVDATAEKDLASKFEIQGFPTIYLFRNGKHEAYNGGRTADKIVEWIDFATGPAVLDVVNMKEASDVKVDNKVKVIGQFTSKTSDEYKMFETVADSKRQMGKFVAVVNPKVEKANQVTMQHSGEELVQHALTTEALFTEFLQSEEFPLFGPVNGETYSKYSERSENWFWVASDTEAYEKLAPVIRKVSKNYRTDYNFVWLDIKDFEGHAKSGLGLETFPGIAVQTTEGRYLYTEDINEKKITKFLESVRSGKAEKHFKSEPIPETNDEPVKVVVGKSFEKIVLDNDKDVLLEIYAPWCGHCKQLQPLYEEFATNMKDSKHLVVAKMDGTANEPSVSGFDYNGFPTLYFVPAGASKPMPFDGARTVEGFTEFVKKNAKHPVTVSDGGKDEL